MIWRTLIILVALTFLIPVHASAYEFEGIPILPKVFDPPYDQDLYKHWIDADGDREDTRWEISGKILLNPPKIGFLNSKH